MTGESKDAILERVRMLADGVDRELDADRRFFRRRPDRSFRVRRGFRKEVETFDLMNGRQKIPQGHVFYIAVWQIRPKLRLRAYFGAPSSLETDLSEDAAREVWNRVADPELMVRFTDYLRKIGRLA